MNEDRIARRLARTVPSSRPGHFSTLSLLGRAYGACRVLGDGRMAFGDLVLDEAQLSTIDRELKRTLRERGFSVSVIGGSHASGRRHRLAPYATSFASTDPVTLGKARIKRRLAVIGAVCVTAALASACLIHAVPESSAAEVGAAALEASQPAQAEPGDLSHYDYLCYDQGDEPWASAPYQSSSIESSGCGACATAEALTMLLGDEITPDELAGRMREYADANGGINFGDGPGTSWDGWEEVLEGMYGGRVNVDQIPSDSACVRAAIEAGHPVVFSVPAGFDGIRNADGTFRATGGGHVMCAYRYADGAYYVKDSASKLRGGGLGNAIPYSEDEFASAMRALGDHFGYCFALSLA